MSTPKGMRAKQIQLASSDAIHVYSHKTGDIVLQLRRAVPTEQDLLTTSFKVAVSLTAAEALELAGELLTAASGQFRKREVDKK
jgi:hypothetical protein